MFFHSETLDRLLQLINALSSILSISSPTKIFIILLSANIYGGIFLAIANYFVDPSEYTTVVMPYSHFILL